MSGLEQLAVLAAGLGAGILTSTVGVASLLSFPVLLAIGLPPVTANVSNTLGLTPGGLSGSFGYRAELRQHPRLAALILGVCAGGSVLGAALLLGLPPGVFEVVVPYLILFTCLLVGVQPTISRLLRRGREPGPDRMSLSPVATGFAALVGVYGGYFGAGAGVMMVAVLGFGTDLPLASVNALKTLALMAGNVVASLIFVFVADVDWAVAGLLAAGSVVGGYVGARIGRRLPPVVFRVLVVLAGVVTAATMLA
ncbi:sulfite exporter TauE/SafE family protein [Nocardioides pantholopis]|uniref:sulfite exporter TauE/SafE family protein n=1 Tax=Nocardioides pantholopis TaxID=2483798 RepID=UPI000F0982ED|nr:sulfite exporter TauE/SafE family protein [Nocardioides pantholopis]